MKGGGSPGDTALTQAGDGVPLNSSAQRSQLGQSPTALTRADSLWEGRHRGSGAVA